MWALCLLALMSMVVAGFQPNVHPIRVDDHGMRDARTSSGTTTGIGHGKLNATSIIQPSPNEDLGPGKLNGTSTNSTTTTTAIPAKTTLTTTPTIAENITTEQLIVKRQCCTTKPAAVCCPTTEEEEEEVDLCLPICSRCPTTPTTTKPTTVSGEPTSTAAEAMTAGGAGTKGRATPTEEVPTTIVEVMETPAGGPTTAVRKTTSAAMMTEAMGTDSMGGSEAPEGGDMPTMGAGVTDSDMDNAAPGMMPTTTPTTRMMEILQEWVEDERDLKDLGLFADDVHDQGLLTKLAELTSNMKIMMSERARGAGLRAGDRNNKDSDLITDWAEGLEGHQRRGSWGSRMRNLRRFRYLQGQMRKQMQMQKKMRFRAPGLARKQKNQQSSHSQQHMRQGRPRMQQKFARGKQTKRRQQQQQMMKQREAEKMDEASHKNTMEYTHQDNLDMDDQQQVQGPQRSKQLQRKAGKVPAGMMDKDAPPEEHHVPDGTMDLQRKFKLRRLAEDDVLA